MRATVSPKHDHPIPAERFIDPTPERFDLTAYIASLRPAWMADGACTDHPTPDIFFPEPGAGHDAAAKAVCATCPVADTCLAHALENEDHGVWGGKNAGERRAMRRANKPGPRRSPIDHGTINGYRSHRRRGEDACPSCLAAHRTRSAELREKARARRAEMMAVAS